MKDRRPPSRPASPQSSPRGSAVRLAFEVEHSLQTGRLLLIAVSHLDPQLRASPRTVLLVPSSFVMFSLSVLLWTILVTGFTK